MSYNENSTTDAVEIDHSTEAARDRHGDQTEPDTIANGPERATEQAKTEHGFFWEDRFVMGRGKLNALPHYTKEIQNAARHYLDQGIEVGVETEEMVETIAEMFDRHPEHVIVTDFIDSVERIMVSQAVKLATLESTFNRLLESDKLSDTAQAYAERIDSHLDPLARYRYAETLAKVRVMGLEPDVGEGDLRKRVNEELAREGQNLYDRYVKQDGKPEITAEQRAELKAKRLATMRSRAA